MTGALGRASRFAWRIATHVRQHALRDGAVVLASSVAFDALLAFVPFALLVIALASFVLPIAPRAAVGDVVAFVARLLPEASEESRRLVAAVLRDVVRTRTQLGIAGALGFLWFSSRLFAALRLVLARVFSEPAPRAGLAGMAFDLWVTLVAAAFGTGWLALQAALAAASAAGGRWLHAVGADGWAVPRPAQLVAGRALAVALVAAIFFALYRTIPRRRVPWPSALAGAATAAVALEAARWVFGVAMRAGGGLTLYTGTVAAIALVMFWAWYAALSFILGGEVMEAVEAERAAVS